MKFSKDKDNDSVAMSKKGAYKNATDDDEAEGAMADLYPRATLLFADIAGKYTRGTSLVS